MTSIAFGTDAGPVIGARRAPGAEGHAVLNPYDESRVGTCSLGDTAAMREAIAMASRAANEAAALPSRIRAEVLDTVRDRVAEHSEQLARLLAAEAGKPIRQARTEVERALFVLRLGSEEAGRVGGEVIPLDRMAHGDGRWALTRRFPLSPIAGIIPFNFPLLLAAHKLAPAVSCGATMVLKPPPQDPLAVLFMFELFLDAGYPDGALNAVPATVDSAAPLIQEPGIRMISFTGSARAGWEIRRLAGHKKVALELGGNAGVIVHSDADLDYAMDRCVAGGFAYAGQSCISVQRILVHQSLYDRFVAELVQRVSALRAGDPLDEDTDVGPLIDESSARRVEEWIGEAVSSGAELVVGGSRQGAVVSPAVLSSTTEDMKVNCEEVFGPVVTVSPYEDFDDALAAVNGSRYGLQAGVFTRDLKLAWKAFEELEVGGVAINEISGFRVDHMPYGGVKDSGLGREGVRYAIDEMTEMRLLMLNPGMGEE